jgi:hypothetical protein
MELNPQATKKTYLIFLKKLCALILQSKSNKENIKKKFTFNAKKLDIY